MGQLDGREQRLEDGGQLGGCPSNKGLQGNLESQTGPVAWAECVKEGGWVRFFQGNLDRPR